MDTLIAGETNGWENKKMLKEIRLRSLFTDLNRAFRKMGVISCSKILQRGSFLLAILRHFVKTKIWMPIVGMKRHLIKRLKEWEIKMVGAIEKGIEAAEFSKPVSGVYEGLDLRVLPKYISFKAALLHNKLTQQYIILILSTLLVFQYVMNRTEIYSLYGKLREKEYILAPGVVDFTAASPKSVPDNYIASAVTDFLSQLGNITPGNVEDQYMSLSDFMSPQLRVKFLAEAGDFKTKVKSENISELLTITEKQILPNDDGYYKVTALGRRDTYINNEYLGHVDEAFEMILQLIPPKSGKRWYLQINSLSRQTADTYRAKKRF